MQIVETIAALRAFVDVWRAEGWRVAFVPTMGNLHAGHFALIERARQAAGRVIASVFVNPAQFGPSEDFARYPRTPEQDAAGLAMHGCDLLFLPAVEEVYPFGIARAVNIHVPGLSDILCGAHRPGHFDGVATVVTRLLHMANAQIAVFGEKDYQQLQIIRYLVRDLALPMEVIGVPTRREPDGLAMSSRNQYLNPEQRRQAAVLFQVLREMQHAVESGESLTAVENTARMRLIEAGFQVDYAEIRREDLDIPELNQRQGLVALVAVRLGQTRLIDNLILDRSA